MSQMNTILQTIVTEMRANMTVANGYSCTPTIFKGYHTINIPSLPCIDVAMDNPQAREDLKTTLTLECPIIIAGHAGMGDGDENDQYILALLEDTLQFLENDCSYAGVILLDQNIELSVGMMENSINILSFVIRANIDVTYDRETINS
jgi:hypothetical protein